MFIATSNYVGNNGSGLLMANRETAQAPVTAANYGGANGLLFVNSNIRFRDIPDGTSNVILVGERAYATNSSTGRVIRGAAVAYGTGGMMQAPAVNAIYPSVRDAQPTPTVTTYIPQAGLQDHLAAGFYPPNYDDATVDVHVGEQIAFSSPHPGVVQFVIADGSVAAIAEGINSDSPGSGSAGTFQIESTWERLLARDDGEPTGEY